MHFHWINASRVTCQCFVPTASYPNSRHRISIHFVLLIPRLSFYKRHLHQINDPWRYFSERLCRIGHFAFHGLPQLLNHVLARFYSPSLSSIIYGLWTFPAPTTLNPLQDRPSMFHWYLCHFLCCPFAQTKELKGFLLCASRKRKLATKHEV